MSDQLKILLIEDNPGDADLIKEFLSRHELDDYQIKWVHRLCDGKKQLNQNKYDLILLDLGLPDSEGSKTIDSLKKIIPDTPFVVLTGLDDEKTGMEAVKSGAQDYMIKSELNRHYLISAIRNAIERHKIYKELRDKSEKVLESEKTILSMINAITEAAFLMDISGNIIAANAETARRLNTSKENLIGKNLFNTIPPELAKSLKSKTSEVIRIKKPIKFEDIHKDNITLNTVYPIIDIQGEISKLAVFSYDITDRKNMEKTLRDSENRLRGILSSMVDMVFALDKDGKFNYYHTKEQDDLYLTPDNFKGKRFFDVMPEKLSFKFERAFQKNKEGETSDLEYSLTYSESERWFSSKLSPVFIDGNFEGAVAVVRDITSRKESEIEREKLILDLQNALEKIITLKGIIPICAYCKKIRDDSGFWKKVETYIQEHSDADFTHGVCPECKDNVLKDFFGENKIDNEKPES
jgi:PAS domain S-box-containing protein